MIELRWVGRELQYRVKDFGHDPWKSEMVVGSWGHWVTVKQRREMPRFVNAARKICEAYSQHGVGPEFPELEAAIEEMQAAFEESIWDHRE